MIIISILAIIFFVFTFSLTRERIKPLKSQKSSLKEDLKNLATNIPWFILIGAGVFTLIFNSVRDGSAMYYFKYLIGDKILFILFEFRITYSTGYIVLGQVCAIIGVILARPVSDRFSKKWTFFFAMLISAVLSFIFYTFSKQNLLLIFLFQALISICAAIIFPLLWSMYADISDYSEWKSRRRSTGLIFSSLSMSQKLGWTLGGAITGWLLAIFGYKANVIQSAETENGIRLMMSIIPGIGALLSGIFIYFYKLSDKYMLRVTNELKEKREADE